MEPSFPGAQHGGSSAPAGATMEEASHARSCGDREPVGGRKASDEGREGAPPFKAVLALRKKKERAQTSELWATMELLAPTLEENKGVPGGQRSKLLRTGRSKEELLKDVLAVVRYQTALAGSRTRQALEVASCQAGLVTVHLDTGKIAHASRAFQELGSWLFDGCLFDQHLSVLLHPDDKQALREFFMGASRGKVRPGASMTLRFLRRPPGRGLRAPKWILVYTQPITVTLSKIVRTTEGAHAVLVADLRSNGKIHYGVQAAHIRNLVESEMMNRTYALDWDSEGMDPAEMVMAHKFHPDMYTKRSAISSLCAAATKTFCKAVSWVVKKVVSVTLTVKFLLLDDDTLHLEGIHQPTFVGGSTFTLAEIITLGTIMVHMGDSPISAKSSISSISAKSPKSPDSPNSRASPISTNEGASDSLPEPATENDKPEIEMKKPMTLAYVVVDDEVGLTTSIAVIVLMANLKKDGTATTAQRADSMNTPQETTARLDAPWFDGDKSGSFRFVGKVIGGVDQEVAELRRAMQGLQPPSVSETECKDALGATTLWEFNSK